MSLHVRGNPLRAQEYRRKGYWGDASLYDYWRLASLTSPGKLAVKDCRGTGLSYEQVDQQASRIASYLLSRGVQPGDIVSVQLPNWSEYLCVDVACLKIGAVINPVLTNHRSAELRHILTLCGSKVLFMATHFRSTSYGELASQMMSEFPSLEVVVMLENCGVTSGTLPSLGQVLEESAPLAEDACTPGCATDVVAVLFTSGSEARPKGVLLSHNNVIDGERSFAYEMGIGFNDRMFMPAPLAHATGYLHGMTMPFMVGGTSILLDVFRGDAALAMIKEERCTCAYATASVVSDILDACVGPESLSPTLRFLCCGGSPLPRLLLHRAAAHGLRLYNVYGSTESAPHMLTTVADSEDRVLNTDGRPALGVEVKVVDPVSRNRVLVGVQGEEASRGPGVFLGYLGEPELTAAVLDRDGWYYSGDLCVMDNDGYVRITGRKTDVIIRGGENISATEVESIILDYPGVRAVAVVAMPNERMGECACAYLVMDSGAPDIDLKSLRDFLVERGVANYKIPERLEIVDALPMTPSGKVRRVELKQRIAAKVEAAASPELAPMVSGDQR